MHEKRLQLLSYKLKCAIFRFGRAVFISTQLTTHNSQLNPQPLTTSPLTTSPRHCKPLQAVTYYLIAHYLFIYIACRLLPNNRLHYNPKRCNDRITPFHAIFLSFRALYRGRAPLSTTQ